MFQAPISEDSAELQQGEVYSKERLLMASQNTHLSCE